MVFFSTRLTLYGLPHKGNSIKSAECQAENSILTSLSMSKAGTVRTQIQGKASHGQFKIMGSEFIKMWYKIDLIYGFSLKPPSI